MKYERFLPFITLLGFSVVSLIFLAWNQKSLCTDSRVVERIDRISSNPQETVYRCSLSKRVTYSAFWGENLFEINQRILKVERFLEGIEPFKRRYQVSIFSDRPYLLRVQGSQIFIGEKLLLAPGQLERLWISLWVYEKSQKSIEQPHLFLESFIDFMSVVAWGHGLSVENPLTGVLQNFETAEWPTVMKSQAGYCQSQWVLPQHLKFCSTLLSGVSRGEANRTQFVELSLRPYALKALATGFSDLSLADKNKIYLSLAKIVRGLDLKIEEQKKNYQLSDVEAAKTSLMSFGDDLFKIAMDLSLSSLSKLASNYRIFVYDQVVEEQISLAKVDYVFEFENQSFEESNRRVQLLSQWVENNPEIKIAVVVANEIYFLPSRTPLDLSNFGTLMSRYRVIQGCDGFSMNRLLSLDKATERVLLINSCEKNLAINDIAFVQGGIDLFARKNISTEFAYLHLPSLLSKRSELEGVGSLFANIQHQQTPLAKILGWQNIDVEKDTGVASPKAIVEGIQKYRIKRM